VKSGGALVTRVRRMFIRLSYTFPARRSLAKLMTKSEKKRLSAVLRATKYLFLETLCKSDSLSPSLTIISS
jgi:hypothetical protein